MATDSLLLDVTRKLLRDVAYPQTRRRGAAGADARGAAWRALDEHGLTRAWLPEASGGAGASLAEGFEILTLAGEFALDLPLAETLLAAWLLDSAGLKVPDGSLAPVAAPVDLAAEPGPAGIVGRVPALARSTSSIAVYASGGLSGRAAAVPFAREVDRLVVVAGAHIVRVDRSACRIEPHDNLAGEPRDTVIFDGAVTTAIGDAANLADRLLAMGAVARACQMAGALRGVLARSVAYAGERVAFEKPIGKFQAIQHALARLADETAAALAASGSAADALASGETGDALLLEVASAKIRVGEAAAAGAAIAHQVHGAIGFSTEHPLHLFTQRLWAWRDDFGSETAWAVKLGNRVAALGGDALWPLVAAR